MEESRVERPTRDCGGEEVERRSKGRGRGEIYVIMVSSRARPAVCGEADSQAGPEREGAGPGRELEGSSAGANGRWLEAMKHGRSDQQRTSRAIHLASIDIRRMVEMGQNVGMWHSFPPPPGFPLLLNLMDEIYDACENLYVPSEAHTGHCHHEEVQKLLISIELLIHRASYPSYFSTYFQP